MKHLYPHLAARVFDCPLAIHPVKGRVIARVLGERLGVDLHIDPKAMDDEGASIEVSDSYQVERGVAIIRIAGTLVQRSSFMGAMCGMIGYDQIRRDFLSAMHDPDVRAVALEIDSPGGEVAGCFDLVDLIHSYRDQKPTLAILNESAYSAGYALASACEQITVPRTGGTGSVGVIAMHVDYSKALAQAGTSVTLITFGDRKAEGNEFKPLSDDALARIQADVDEMGELFVETVARNRNLSTAKVRATQAGTYLGAAGVEIGFADAVQAPDEAFRSLLAELG